MGKSGKKAGVKFSILFSLIGKTKIYKLCWGVYILVVFSHSLSCEPTPLPVALGCVGGRFGTPELREKRLSCEQATFPRPPSPSLLSLQEGAATVTDTATAAPATEEPQETCFWPQSVHCSQTGAESPERLTRSSTKEPRATHGCVRLGFFYFLP